MSTFIIKLFSCIYKWPTQLWYLAHWIPVYWFSKLCNWTFFERQFMHSFRIISSFGRVTISSCNLKPVFISMNKDANYVYIYPLFYWHSYMYMYDYVPFKFQTWILIFSRWGGMGDEKKLWEDNFFSFQISRVLNCRTSEKMWVSKYLHFKIKCLLLYNSKHGKRVILFIFTG